jgi:ABC-type transporter Mla maintaining outer membrane lipid asymmetry ATPase subunit MlaF
MTEAFSAEDIRFSFLGMALLKGISFNVAQGGMFAIAGRSGCGKSTLLEICSGQRTPQSGRVLWNGENIAGMTHDGHVKAFQHIGFVFQKHALIHNFTVFDNIALPLRYHRDISEREVRTAVRQCMDELGLFNVDQRFPNELSAAQSRCAAIARAVVMGPSLLFLDEPTEGVDPVTARGIGNVLRGMNRSRGLALILVCNNAEILKLMECPVSVLDDGKLYDINDPSAACGAEIFSALREAL